MAGLNTSQIIGRAKEILGRDISGSEADQILSQAWDQGQWGADQGKVDSILRSYSGSSSSSGNSYVDTGVAAADPLAQAETNVMKYLSGKYGNNWYDIDEEQYRAASEEQYDPYYQAELGDYMTGITRQKDRSKADEEKLRGELTTQTENYVGRAKREIDSSLESSREGFAGAGLYFSGKRIKKEGEIGITGEENIRDYTRETGLKAEESQLRQQRLGEDLSSNVGTYKRNWTANRETALRGSMAQQSQEEMNRRLLEGAQYGGGDYTGQLTTNILSRY